MRRIAPWLVTFTALVFAAPAGAAARPDLAVRQVSAGGLTVTNCTATGCDLRLSAAARVLNRGGKRAARTPLAFLLSRDGRRDRADIQANRLPVKAIRAGRTRSAQAALTLTRVAPGVYRLIACADVARRVRERREANNCKAGAPFTVQAPAAAVPAPAPDPQAPASPAAPQAPAACAEGWRKDLCDQIRAKVAAREFFDLADVLTFALLYQHFRTQQPIPPSIAAGLIEPVRRIADPVRGQTGLPNYRVAGYLNFWAYDIGYGSLDWTRYPDALDTQAEFDSWWNTYGIVQFTARQNAINQVLNAILQSELAWRNAMDSLKAYDLRLLTAQQYSDATVFAQRTLDDAQAAIAAAG